MKSRHRGRPPAGPNGKPRVSLRHQISARLSPDTYKQLKALSAILQISQADVIARGFDALQASLPASERRLVTLLRKRDQQ